MSYMSRPAPNSSREMTNRAMNYAALSFGVADECVASKDSSSAGSIEGFEA